MWRLTVISLCAVVASIYGQTTQVTQCPNYPGLLPIKTYVDGCDQPPCVLPQLQNVTFNIVFKSPRTTSNIVTTLVTAHIPLLGVPISVNYSLEENSTCNFLTNTYCPVSEGAVVEYQQKMLIESFIPVGTQVTLELRVVDENQDPVFCIRLGIRIVAPLNPLPGNANATVLVDQ